MRHAVVVGAGIAGLVMARELVLGGFAVTLVEASDHLGGKVARHVVAGITLDAGAESFATRRGTVADLARQLGLEESVVRPNADGAWLQNADGTAFPLPKTGILGIPGTPLAEDVIRAIGLKSALRAHLDGVMDGLIGSKERNLGKLVRKRMGRAVLEQLVAPVTLGIHSRHPDELDVDVVAPGLRTAMLSTGSLGNAVKKLRAAAPAGSAVSGIDGGIYEIVEAFSRDFVRFGVSVRLSSPVASVDADGVTLASGERIEADRVILATPLTADAEPSIALVTLVIDSEPLDSAPRGTGLLVAPGSTTVRAKALTHATAKWSWLAAHTPDHRHVLRLSYASAARADLFDSALADAAALLDVPIDKSQVLGFDIIEWTAPALRADAVEGVCLIGEGVAGTGLAAVVLQARQEAARLLAGVEG